MTHPKHTGLANRPNGCPLWRAIDKPFSGNARPHSGKPALPFWAGMALVGPRSRALVLIGIQ
jgi:hypothetical protein